MLLLVNLGCCNKTLDLVAYEQASPDSGFWKSEQTVSG